MANLVPNQKQSSHLLEQARLNKIIETKLGAEQIANFRPVEFRCMIQDILDNEIYTKYNNELGDRTIFYCITIPGENEWVRNCPEGDKNEFMTNNNTINSATTSSSSTTSLPKTPASPLSNASLSANNTSTTAAAAAEENGNSSSNSANNNDVTNSRLSLKLVNWSYPIPSDGKNRSCLIKVYDNNLVEHLRVNDIVHVTGLVEPIEFEDVDTQLTDKSPPSNHNGTSGVNNELMKESLTGFHSEFEPASDFPHRLVPRVHVTTLKKLNHVNPLLPDVITRDQIDITAIKLARVRLSTILTQLFGGDTLAADYLILSLISRIHRRKDLTTLGQLTIGFSGIRPEMNFLIEKLYEIIKRITTHSHYIDMSIANLNNLRFTPKKDHDNNKMIAGTFQLPDGLYLMLNETALSEGQLTAQGTENLSTLNQIIRWQKHKYDFKFHSVEIDTDLKVLVMSEGKSILHIPYDIRVRNDSNTVEAMRQACYNVNAFLTEDLLNKFRYYITALKDVPEYNIPDDVQKRIQDDFVAWRRVDSLNNRTLYSASDLSSFMTLARYLTISKGETQLTHELWKETCDMEFSRQSRLSAH